VLLWKGPIYGTIDGISYKTVSVKENDMFGIGLPELLIIAALALILIGPKKLPDLAKSLGKTLGELRKATDDVKETIFEEIKPIKDDLPSKWEMEEALKKKFIGGEEEEKGKAKAKGKEKGKGSKGKKGPQTE
jgi:Tat protein translocase TatB subunit